MSRNLIVALAAVAIIIATIGTVYFRQDSAQHSAQGPNKIIIKHISSRPGVATPPVSSNDKVMTMVFTKSKQEYSGLWIYLVFTEAFKRMGMELVFETCPAERCSFLSDHGKVDGELSRISIYNLSHPNLIRVEETLSSVTWAAFTMDPDIYVHSWESLREGDYRVEYRQGLAEAENRLYEYLSEDNISSVSSVAQGFKKLAAGRTDIYVDIAETAAPYLVSEEFKGAKILRAGILEVFPLHAFLHKKNESYVPALSAILKEMKQDGSFERYIDIAEQKLGMPPVMGRLQNAGFEQVRDGDPVGHWRLSGPENSYLPDRDVHIEGQYSMQILLPQHSGDGVSLLQVLAVEAGRRYDLGGSIKTRLEEGFATVSVTFLDKAGQEIETQSLPHVIDESPWAYQNLWIKSPNGADMARVICIVGATAARTNGTHKATF